MDDLPQAAAEFARLVHERLDPIAGSAGLRFNAPSSGTGDDGQTTSLLYEGLPGEFLAAFPGLAPVWDEEWMAGAPCVDLWIHYHHTDGRIAGNLEHWEFDELAGRYGDDDLGERLRTALAGGGHLAARLDAIAGVLQLAFERSRPAPGR